MTSRAGSVLGFFFVAVTLSDGPNATAKPERQNGRASLSETYGKLPLHFELNQGQVDSRVRFISRGRDHVLYLAPGEAVMTLGTERLRMELIGSSVDVLVDGDALPGRSNYFLGNDPMRWHTNVPNYSKVRFRGVYPHIDLAYHGREDHLEYDFIVEAGADPSAIRLRIEGTVDVRLDKYGHLAIETKTGELLMRKPVAYQDVDGTRNAVPARYDVQPDGSVAFRVGTYSKRWPLIIDPVLVYSSFLGGSVGDHGEGIGMDAAGNVYVTGLTGSLDFPKVSAMQPLFGGGSFDGFVSKISPDGSTLIYSTYLGGSGSFDQGYGLAVDPEGNVYVTGETNSTNFPMMNPLQGTYGGNTDVFLTKLNPQGSALVYSTYLGGTNVEQGLDVAVDSARQVHVTGFTISTNFPTKNSIQPSFGGGARDAFVAKIDASGSALVYSTYLGGSGSDEARGIATDATGNAYVTGDTRSTDFPTMNPLQSAAVGFAEIFVTKISADGSSLAYSTYLGGSGTDESFGLKLIAVDAAGNAYITSATGSTNFPLKNPLQSVFRGVRDIVLSKISADGSQLVYSTYLGGADSEDAYGIGLDRMGNAYVTGRTQSIDFPTLNAFQPNHGGSIGDAFVAGVKADGSALLYSSYLGGNGDDRGNAMAIDTAGNLHVTGQTYSSNFPTLNPLQPAYGGTGDAFVAKIGTVLAPATVVNLAWSAGAKIVLEWAAAPGAETYHVFRGVGADLPKLLDGSVDSCLRLSVAALSTGPTLTEAPDAGELYWFLVRAQNANGMGPAGDATVGPRVQDSAGGCP